MSEETKSDIPEFTDIEGNPLSEAVIDELSNGKGDDDE